MELLTVCVESSHFQVGKHLYSQISESPMSWELSSILSDIYMKMFQEISIDTWNNEKVTGIEIVMKFFFYFTYLIKHYMLILYLK